MRTNEQIVQRIKERQKDDIFGFEVNEYITRLPFEFAKEFLKEGTTKEEWEKDIDKRPIKEVMNNYMKFAKEKAESGRGISANRSIYHYVAWLWLDENEILANKILDEYTNYGIPQLKEICKYLGLNYDEV